jgi:hypothetical protein
MLIVVSQPMAQKEITIHASLAPKSAGRTGIASSPRLGMSCSRSHVMCWLGAALQSKSRAAGPGMPGKLARDEV